MRRIVLALFVASQAGRATLVTGIHDTVRVVSDPIGATVQVDWRNAGTTPMSVDVSKNNPGVIAVHPAACDRIELPLSRDMNGWVWSNVLLAYVGIATVAADFVTGGAYSVREDAVGARCVDGQTHPFTAVVVGMTAAQVRAAWGDPKEVNRTSTSAGTSEQWVYGNGYYVYVENGVVTAIQATTSGRAF